MAFPVAEVWNGHNWIHLYDVSETVPRKPVTEKQLLSIAKAREAMIIARTCLYVHDAING